MSFLDLDGLTKVYGETIAVDHLSLTLDKVETVTLLCHSGCGKSSTLKIIAGFV